MRDYPKIPNLTNFFITMNEEIMNPEPTGMIVNEKMKADLLSAKKWANFLLSIRCFAVLFLVFYALILFVLGGATLGGAKPFAGVFGAGLGIFMLVMAAVAVYLIIKGFQFVYGIEEACYTNDVSSAVRGFAGMRAFLRCMGIITIVITSVSILFLLLMIIGIAAR